MSDHEHVWVEVRGVWGQIKGWQCWLCGKWWDYTGRPPCSRKVR